MSTNIFKFIIIAAICWGIQPISSNAQMFSVGEEKPRFNIPRSHFYLAVEPTDVSYDNAPDGGATGAGQFAFNGPLLRVGYSNPFTEISLASGGGVTGLDHASYFDVQGSINLGIGLYRSKPLSVTIPIRISSRFVNMTNDESFFPNFNNFRFGDLMAGAGAKIMIRPAEKMRIRLRGVPGYGFAFATGGTHGGGISSLNTSSRLYFDRLFGKLGLGIGYRYNFRRYNIDEDVFDYKMNGHRFELGITF